MVEPILCVHCGAVAKHPVTKVIDGQPLIFCCGGCLQVYEMMHEEGFVSSGAAGSETKVGSQGKALGPAKTLVLSIGGMSCANCVASVAGSLRKVNGVLSVDVDLTSGKATIETIASGVALDSLKKAVKAAGYTVM
jgi:copper chaperone CopZ